MFLMAKDNFKPLSTQKGRLTFHKKLSRQFWITYNTDANWITKPQPLVQNKTVVSATIGIIIFLSSQTVVPQAGAYTVRKVLFDLAVFDSWLYCKALCDVKFSNIEGSGKTFCHNELSNSVIS